MITKGSYNKENCAKHQLFFNSARCGFELLLSKTFTCDNDTILMPGYIGESAKEGSGVFDPIRHTGVKYQFYKINEDLSADYNDILEKLENKDVKAVLLIHYFGFPQECLFNLAEICKSKGVILIEDCAHTFSTMVEGKEIGSIGDFALFSIHKLLTTENGGMLQVNNEQYWELFKDADENIVKSDLLMYAKTDLKAIAAKKVDNYIAYLRYLNKDSNIVKIIYPELKKGVVPNNFPVIIRGYDRFQMYNELDAKGIPTVVLYYRMIGELSKEDFPVSYRLADTILNLPLHQDIDEGDIQVIAETLNSYSNKLLISI